MTKKELFENFEKNWMRLLSPFEIEDIEKWIDEDKMSIGVVNEALKETVIYNAPNLRYLNRVLNNWKRQGTDTVEKVEIARIQFENKKLVQAKERSTTNVPSWSNTEYRDPTYDDLKVNPSEVSDGSGDF